MLHVGVLAILAHWVRATPNLQLLFLLMLSRLR